MMIRLLSVLFASSVAFAASAQTQEPRYERHKRYTVKFFCDDVPDNFHLLHRGHYRTAISIYNPDFNTAQISVQAASINPTSPAMAATVEHDKVPAEVSAHSVQLIGCQEIKDKFLDRKKDDGKSYKIGLLIITSVRQLDVTTVYSVAARAEDPVTSFSMGEVARQTGRSCTENKKIELPDVRNWETESRARPVSLSIRRTRPRNDLAPGRYWMEYGSAAVTGAEYFYRLRYCMCSGGGKLSGDVRSEGASTGTLHAQSAAKIKNDSKIEDLWNMQGQANPTADSAPVRIKDREGIRLSYIGDGYIEVKVNRGPGSSAISFTGDITLEDGYAGRCMQ